MPADGNQSPRVVFSWQDVPCNLCGGRETELLFTRRDVKFRTCEDEFRVVMCRRCRLAYVNPRPAEADIGKFYGEGYDPFVRRPRDAREVEALCAGKAPLVEGRRPGKLLDVGCAAGEFLQFMKGRGWEVRGVEKSPSAPDWFQLGICRGELAAAGFPGDEFDLATMFEVIEHVYDPLAVLKDIHRVVKPGGELVVTTTNIRSIPTRFMKYDDVPRHLTLFSQATLTAMLEQAGFRDCRFEFSQRLNPASARGYLEWFWTLLTETGEEEWLSRAHGVRGPMVTLEGGPGPARRRGILDLGVKVLDRLTYPIVDAVACRLGFHALMAVTCRKPL